MVRSSGQCSEAAASGSSIAGGFVLVPVAVMMACWRACQSRPLGIGDFRAWLACHEMVARRCRSGEGRIPTYTVDELARLLGVSKKRAGASVKRLVAAGFLGWSDSAIVFPSSPAEDPALHDTIGRGRGNLAVPRKILRLLAGGARPALIAAALATLLRCLSRRRGGFNGWGRIKASWIARIFGVDLRRVKAARAELIALGWIAPEPADQSAENRWGRAYRIDLAWDRVDPEGRRLPPLPAADRPAIATPSINQDPLQERRQNQDPARSGPAGVDLKASTGTNQATLPAPSLADVRPEDLTDVGRTLRLFELAVALGLVVNSEADRLKFLAIAEHARAIGTVNPCGLFVRLIRRGLWHFATLDDEDAARRRLRQYLHGQPEPTAPPPPPRSSTFVPDAPAPAPSSLASVMERLLAGRFN